MQIIKHLLGATALLLIGIVIYVVTNIIAAILYTAIILGMYALVIDTRTKETK